MPGRQDACVFWTMDVSLGHACLSDGFDSPQERRVLRRRAPNPLNARVRWIQAYPEDTPVFRMDSILLRRGVSPGDVRVIPRTRLSSGYGRILRTPLS